jgi:type IV secretory pathway TrbD component
VEDQGELSVTDVAEDIVRRAYRRRNRCRLTADIALAVLMALCVVAVFFALVLWVVAGSG